MHLVGGGTATRQRLILKRTGLVGRHTHVQTWTLRDENPGEVKGIK